MISPIATRPSLESERFHVVIIGGGINGVAIARECARAGKRTILMDQHKLERLLDAGRRWSVFSFEDAQCEFPERLVAEWLVEAIEAGATARNHTQVLAVDVRHGRASAILMRDRLSGKEERVEANWVINATGPWADRVCQRSR